MVRFYFQTTMKPINETGRLAISMKTMVQEHKQLRLYPLAEETTILLVSEQQDSDPPIWSIAASPQWAYSALGEVCRNRAYLAEKGKILVDGQRVKAEEYLKLWRKATESPIEWQASLDAGILITATFTMPAAFIANVISGDERYSDLQAFLQTPAGQPTKADEQDWSWSVPMNHLDHLLSFARLCDCYPEPKKYGRGKAISFAVTHQGANAAAVDENAAQASLFAEAA